MGLLKCLLFLESLLLPYLHGECHHVKRFRLSFGLFLASVPAAIGWVTNATAALCPKLQYIQLVQCVRCSRKLSVKLSFQDGGSKKLLLKPIQKSITKSRFSVEKMLVSKRKLCLERLLNCNAKNGRRGTKEKVKLVVFLDVVPHPLFVS